MATEERPGTTWTRRRLLIAGAVLLLVAGTGVGELRDRPLDLVRVGFRLVLGGLQIWFYVWLFRTLARARHR